MSGEPNRAFSITLPVDGAIVLATGAGDVPTKQIDIQQFTSYPTVLTGGLLDGAGTQTLVVGATRAALASDQATGSYSGAFTVIVIY